MVPIYHILEKKLLQLVDQEDKTMCRSLTVTISRWSIPSEQSSWLSTERRGGRLCSGATHRMCVLCCSRHPDRCAKTSQKMVHQERLDLVSLGITAHAQSVEGAFLICACCRRGPRSSLAVGSFLWQGFTFVHHGAEENCASSSESGWFLHGQMTVLLLTPLLTSVAPCAVLRKARSMLL